jgi:hypothetical protein
VVVVTSPVPIKPPAFAVTKSVNYLQNVMAGTRIYAQRCRDYKLRTRAWGSGIKVWGLGIRY